MGIRLEQIDNDEYCLFNDVEGIGKDYKVTALQGLVSDGASIPKFLWSFVGSPFTGNYTRASILHDALYQSEALYRADADSFFKEIMKQDKVSFLKRNVMYLAVRVGGYFVWRTHTKNSIQTAQKYVKVEI